jgi:hypothetical protein
MLKLKLFTDLIDDLGKVAGGLKSIVNLPKVERETRRKTLDETFAGSTSRLRKSGSCRTKLWETDRII